jgi:uncharacterized membrane protein YfhO
MNRMRLRALCDYLATFLLPFCILLASFAYRGIYPFGDTSVMLFDMPSQYVNFFGWLSNVLHGQANPFYSFSKGLGGEMTTTFAYYLSSPFNLLAVFFDSEHTPQLFSVLYLVKIPAAAVTCAMFLRNRFPQGRERFADRMVFLLISCAYALSTYSVGYASNIMWLDGVIMLPLVCLGVYRLIEYRSCAPLFAAAAGAILFNWYTGYMVCLFSIFYFFYEYIRGGDRIKTAAKHSLLRCCGRFAAVMACAVGASMFMMLPNILGLLAGKGGNSGLSSLVGYSVISLNPLDLLDYFCIGTFPGIVISNKIPAIAISALVLLLSWVFFFLPCIKKRDRIAAGGVLFILLLSFVFTPWGNVWSGFLHAPSYMDRNAFILLFFMAMLAGEAWLSLRSNPYGGVRKRAALASLLLIGAFMLSAFNVWYRKLHFQPSGIDIALEVALIAAFAFLMLLVLKKRRGPSAICALVLLALVFTGEQFYSTSNLLSLCTVTASSYQSYISQMESAYQTVEDSTDAGGFVRIGQTGFNFNGDKASGADCESLLLGASGFDHYSSTQSSDIQKFLARLGYSKVTPYGTYYASPMLLPDALLSVSYIVDDSTPAGTSEFAGGLPLQEYSFYKNDEALPLGYGVATGRKVNWTDDPFTNQELLIGAMTGQDDKPTLYSQATVSETASDDTSKRTWLVDAAQSGPMYLHAPSIITDASNTGGITCNLYVNGVLQQQIGGNGSCSVVYLGTFSAGETVTLSLEPANPAQTFENQNGTTISAQSAFYQASTDSLVNAQSLDLQAFENLKSLIDYKGFSLSSYQDGAVDATFDAQHDETLLFTIPYDSGWTAYVNGKQVHTSKLYNGLLGVPVSKGLSTVELRYTTPGLSCGIAISIASIVLFCLWRIIEGRCRKRIAKS